jgi:PAS domain S-box-containing protein
MDVAGRLAESLMRAHTRFVWEGDPKPAFDGLLEDLLALTQSEYGFIGEVLTSDAGQQYLKNHAVTDIAWNEETRRMFDENAATGIEFHNLDTLFGAVIRTREPVIANDPANDPRRSGLPSDHPPLEAFLGIPLLSGRRMVGMVGIANRPGGYDTELIRGLAPFLSTCANLVHARRAELEQREANDLLTRRTRADKIANDVVERLIDADFHELDDVITGSLARISEHLGVDRAVYVEVVGDEGPANRTHAWGEPPLGGVGPDSYDLSEIPWLAEHLRARGLLLVPDFSALDTANAERSLFLDAGVRSAAFFGGRHQGDIRGAIVLQWQSRECNVHEADLEPFRAVANVATVALRRRESAETLRRSEERFRSMADSSPVMFWTLDGTDAFANRALKRFLGTDDVTTMTSQVIHPDDVDRVTATYLEAFTEQHEIEIEFRMRRGDGRWRDVMAVGTPHRSEDHAPFTYVASVIDVTERKRLEAERREALKLEAIGRLAGGIAHDFNNLLTVILIDAESAERALEVGVNPDEQIANIQRAALSSAELTQRLLAFGRRAPSSPRALDLNQGSRSAQALLQRLIGEDIRLELDLWAVPLFAVVDPGHLEQLLMNLVLNAQDAMPSGGALRIQTGIGQSGAGEEGVLLRVADSGVGMDEDTLERLFEPFFTTKDVGHGTGLGLATCYGIVHHAGGEISASSVVGSGTTFEIWLPRVSAPLHAAETACVDPAGSLRRGRVLLVEDTDVLRRVMERTLLALDHSVMSAANGEEARNLAQLHPVDLLVTDVMMPGMRGPEVAKVVRAIWPAVRVLYVSGYAESDLELRPETESFLAKPFSTRDLADRVRQLLESSAQYGVKPGVSIAGAPGATIG